MAVFFVVLVENVAKRCGALRHDPGVVVGDGARRIGVHEGEPGIVAGVWSLARPAVAKPVAQRLERRHAAAADEERLPASRALGVDDELHLFVAGVHLLVGRAQQPLEECIRFRRVLAHERQKRQRECREVREDVAASGAGPLGRNARVDETPRRVVVAAQHGDQGPRGGETRGCGLAFSNVQRQGVEDVLGRLEPSLEDVDVGDVGGVLVGAGREAPASLDQRRCRGGGVGRVAQAAEQRIVDVPFRQTLQEVDGERFRQEPPVVETPVLPDHLVEFAEGAGDHVAAEERFVQVRIVPAARAALGQRVENRLQAPGLGGFPRQPHRPVRIRANADVAALLDLDADFGVDDFFVAGADVGIGQLPIRQAHSRDREYSGRARDAKRIGSDHAVDLRDQPGDRRQGGVLAGVVDRCPQRHASSPKAGRATTGGRGTFAVGLRSVSSSNRRSGVDMEMRGLVDADGMPSVEKVREAEAE